MNKGREVQVSATEEYHHFLMNWKDEEKKTWVESRCALYRRKHVRPDNAEVEVSVAEWDLAAS